MATKDKTAAPQPAAAASPEAPAVKKPGGFVFETVSELPDGRAAGQTKYDWSSFPAPVEKDGKTEYARAWIGGVNAKTIYTSINAYKAKLEAKGEEVPEFTVRREKDADDKVTGVWVYRTK